MVEDYFSEKFKLPLNFDTQYLPYPDDRVCVVAVIGKQKLGCNVTKATFVNSIINCDAFQAGPASPNCEIEGYYDTEKRVIYLHLQSALDTSTLAALCKEASNDLANVNGAELWQKAEHQYARAILFLFSVSHIILLVNPGNSFDISYVRFFRVLDTIRLKLQPHMSDVLKTFHAPKEWMLAGRPCSPRVLFIFDSCTLDLSEMDSDQVVMSKTRSQKTPPIKRLQHSIEDQIYRILRKSRVITNISNNSLFAVPANQEFVFVSQKRTDTEDLVGYYLEALRNNCSTVREGDTPKSHSYQGNRRVNQTNNSSQVGTSARISQTGTDTGTHQKHSLKDFLQKHIDLALSKGFDDNVGRNPVLPVFELPVVEVWFTVANKLYGTVVGDKADSRVKSHLNSLKSMLDIDIRFSDSRCAKVLPIAESSYQEGLPQHYTKTYHVKKLQQAKKVFMQHARGPACDKYLQQLEEDCEKLWQNGRQLCEKVSLTGNHCINELHRLQSEAESDDNKHLPVMPHTSQLKTRATCNCGNKQSEREDPFNHKSANYDFFQKLESVCCNKLEIKFEFPVFKASTQETREAMTLGAIKPMASPLLSRKDSARFDGQNNLSLALSLGQSGASDLFQHGDRTSFNPDASQDMVPEANAAAAEDEEIELKIQREHSTIEYLPGMIHSEVPLGVLPKFSSWSLVCLGKPNLYLASQGVDQPNFSHQCNFLLPLDITVRSDPEKWPAVGESGKKQKAFKAFKSGSMEYSLRVYVGFEYECPRGHRFFLSSPDKIFKAPPNGIFKETAAKVLKSDMPMYYPCNCRSSKGYMGQIMRFHMVVPEGPIDVELNPRIQPGTSPCPLFYPCNELPIIIPHEGWWILRFPYIYLGDRGSYLIPKEPSQVIQCHIPKGILTVNTDV